MLFRNAARSFPSGSDLFGGFFRDDLSSRRPPNPSSSSLRAKRRSLSLQLGLWSSRGSSDGLSFCSRNQGCSNLPLPKAPRLGVAASPSASSPPLCPLRSLSIGRSLSPSESLRARTRALGSSDCPLVCRGRSRDLSRPILRSPLRLASSLGDLSRAAAPFVACRAALALANESFGPRKISSRFPGNTLALAEARRRLRDQYRSEKSWSWSRKVMVFWWDCHFRLLCAGQSSVCLMLLPDIISMQGFHRIDQALAHSIHWLMAGRVAGFFTKGESRSFRSSSAA